MCAPDAHVTLELHLTRSCHSLVHQLTALDRKQLHKPTASHRLPTQPALASSKDMAHGVTHNMSRESAGISLPAHAILPLSHPPLAWLLVQVHTF